MTPAIRSAIREIDPDQPLYDVFPMSEFISRTLLTQRLNLVLVSAFAGQENVLAAYAHAGRERYRFFSYGDAMFVTPRKPRETPTGATTP